jgi:phosphotransferase system HPr (HPr) family protein
MNMLRRLQLVAHGEPSNVIELSTVSQPALGQDEVVISMDAAPLNPSDFLFIRGIYGVRPAFPSPVGAEGIGRVTKTGSKVDVALQGKRVLILPTYEQGTWADQVIAPVRNIVPVSDEADPLQLAMIGINPVTAYLLLNRYVSLTPGDWIGQTAANSAMGQYIIELAKLASASSSGRTCRVGYNGTEVDGKSVLDLMTLTPPEGTKVWIRIEGPDAAEAMHAVDQLMQSRSDDD